MINLFAVPFDKYQSSKTDQGIKYNLIDNDGVIHVQVWVAHKPYANHDLLIEEISGSPSSVRNELKKHLDSNIGKDQWKIVTRFSMESVRKTTRLQTTNFIQDCQYIAYNDNYKKIMIDDAHKVQMGGLTY